MKTRYLLSAAAMAAVMTVAVSAAQAEDAPVMEKCFGIVKAGMNDCKSAAHSCAGHSAKDGAVGEFLKVPTGLCDKIVGGSTKEPSDDKMMGK